MDGPLDGPTRTCCGLGFLVGAIIKDVRQGDQVDLDEPIDGRVPANIELRLLGLINSVFGICRTEDLMKHNSDLHDRALGRNQGPSSPQATIVWEDVSAHEVDLHTKLPIHALLCDHPDNLTCGDRVLARELRSIRGVDFILPAGRHSVRITKGHAFTWENIKEYAEEAVRKCLHDAN